MFPEVGGHNRGVPGSFLKKLKGPGLVAWIQLGFDPYPHLVLQGKSLHECFPRTRSESCGERDDWEPVSRSCPRGTSERAGVHREPVTVLVVWSSEYSGTRGKWQAEGNACTHSKGGAAEAPPTGSILFPLALPGLGSSKGFPFPLEISDFMSLVLLAC